MVCLLSLRSIPGGECWNGVFHKSAFLAQARAARLLCLFIQSAKACNGAQPPPAPPAARRVRRLTGVNRCARNCARNCSVAVGASRVAPDWVPRRLLALVLPQSAQEADDAAAGPADEIVRALRRFPAIVRAPRHFAPSVSTTASSRPSRKPVTPSPPRSSPPPSRRSSPGTTSSGSPRPAPARPRPSPCPSSRSSRAPAAVARAGRSASSALRAVPSRNTLRSTTVVSRCLVTPIPAMSAAVSPAFANAARAASICVFQVSFPSCSTHPARGKPAGTRAARPPGWNRRY